jgi:hypothetical protein
MDDLILFVTYSREYVPAICEAYRINAVHARYFQDYFEKVSTHAPKSLTNVEHSLLASRLIWLRAKARISCTSALENDLHYE